MPSINLTNFENVVAHTISEINSTSGVTNIRNIYANQTDIIDLLNNKADQVDTYTKEQINANLYDITQSYNKTEVNVLSNNISSNTFLIGNLTITSNTNFNNISSNSNLITELNSTVNSHISAISDLLNNGGSFNESDYYNKITTNNLLSEKINTSILNNTLIHNITTTSTFKIANFGNYNNFYEMYNYFDSYVYGNLSGATMFLNQRGFGDVEINNSSTFQNDKILLNHNTTILSNLQVSGLFSCSSILDIAGSDARYVLQSDGLSGLITGNTNTINSIITTNNSQDTSLGQKLDKIDTNAQSVAGAINFSDNTTLHSNLNMLTTGSIICNKFSTTSSPNVGLQMTFQIPHTPCWSYLLTFKCSFSEQHSDVGIIWQHWAYRNL